MYIGIHHVVIKQKKILCPLCVQRITGFEVIKRNRFCLQKAYILWGYSILFRFKKVYMFTKKKKKKKDNSEEQTCSRWVLFKLILKKLYTTIYKNFISCLLSLNSKHYSLIPMLSHSFGSCCCCIIFNLCVVVSEFFVIAIDI